MFLFSAAVVFAFASLASFIFVGSDMSNSSSSSSSSSSPSLSHGESYSTDDEEALLEFITAAYFEHERETQHEFQCKQCLKMFPSQQGLAGHMKSHSAKVPKRSRSSMTRRRRTQSNHPPALLEHGEGSGRAQDPQPHDLKQKQVVAAVTTKVEAAAAAKALPCVPTINSNADPNPNPNLVIREPVSLPWTYPYPLDEEQLRPFRVSHVAQAHRPPPPPPPPPPLAPPVNTFPIYGGLPTAFPNNISHVSSYNPVRRYSYSLASPFGVCPFQSCVAYPTFPQNAAAAAASSNTNSGAIVVGTANNNVADKEPDLNLYIGPSPSGARENENLDLDLHL